MANYKTGAQRYNDRMDKIFKKSEELGHHTLHGSTEKTEKHEKKEGKIKEKKEEMAKKMKGFSRSLKKENISYGELSEMQHPKYRKHLMKDARLAEAAGISEEEFRKHNKY